jgi:hypothetical protein
MINLDSLINSSGDSILEQYTYFEGLLRITLIVPDLEKKVILHIKTNNLVFDHYYLMKSEKLFRVCRIELKEIKGILSIENNVFVPSTSFGKMMSETKLNLNLAYGKKASDMQYIFSLVGYSRMISCLVSDLTSISFGSDEEKLMSH